MTKHQAGRPVRISFLLLLAIALAGCDQIDQIVKPIVDRHLSKAASDLQNEIATREKLTFETRKEIADLREENKELRQKVASLEFSNYLNDARLSSIDQSPATITDGDGYGIGRTPQGPVAIVMDKIQPYLDGYKVTLRVGNMAAASMNGGEFEVEWGLQYGAKNATPSQVHASKKTKTFSSTSQFPSGAYTLVDVTLTPATPDEVKTLNVSTKWNIISLRMPPARTGQ